SRNLLRRSARHRRLVDSRKRPRGAGAGRAGAAADSRKGDGMNHQYLTFFIRGEEYAVAILRVKEIIEYETVTRVPATPAHVRGVINLRGAVLPVVDLAAKFGHGTTE